MVGSRRGDLKCGRRVFSSTEQKGSESDETIRASAAAVVAALTLQSRSFESAIFCDSCFSYRLICVVEGSGLVSRF